MNEEFLLQAVGHIDEDLIVQAEEYRLAKRPSLRRPLAGLAACLAVVFGLYWGMNNLGMGSGASNGSASASGGGASSETTTSSNEGQTGDGSPNTVDEVLLVIVPVGDNRYAYYHYYGEDRVLDTLPEGCRSLGEVASTPKGRISPIRIWMCSPAARCGLPARAGMARCISRRRRAPIWSASRGKHLIFHPKRIKKARAIQIV